VDKAAGWLPDAERADQERYWNGSAWTDRVRPAGRSRATRLPDHVPELQRALAAATADIEAVEERLSSLFERTEAALGPRPTPKTPLPSSPAPSFAPGPDDADLDEPIELDDEDAQVEEEDGLPVHAEFAGPPGHGVGEIDGSLAELDAALAAEQPAASAPEEPAPEEPAAPRAPAERTKPENIKRGFLRRS
jgi:hypothetical protein